ncbi:MAG: glutaredoxin family protein [Neisseria sp.]|nr:glutaredoxin family protein [Neisseria sp.]
MKLKLMFREYCSLCRKMREDLQPLQTAYGFELEIIDVDEDEALEAAYNELVPVLLHRDEIICHWYLDEARTRACLDVLCAEEA